MARGTTATSDPTGTDTDAATSPSSRRAGALALKIGLVVAAVVLGLGFGKFLTKPTPDRTVVAGSTVPTTSEAIATSLNLITTVSVASTVTTVLSAPPSVLLGVGPAPTVTKLKPALSIPLQVLGSSGTATSTVEVVDVGLGERRTYAPNEAVLGSSRVPGGGWLVWSTDRVRYFTRNLDGQARSFTGPKGRNGQQIGNPRAVAAADGRTAWLVWGSSNQRVLQRVDLATGATLLLIQPAEDWYPVTTAGEALVLANGPRNETLLVLADGQQRRLPGGIPAGASATRLLRLDCVDRSRVQNCTLHLSNLDGKDDRVLVSPVEGDWSLSASVVPGLATGVSLPTVSPAGGTAVFLVERQRDAGGIAFASQFVLVDLPTGNTRALRDWPGTPVYWSSDGEWLVSVERSAGPTTGQFRALSLAHNAPVIPLEVTMDVGHDPVGGA